MVGVAGMAWAAGSGAGLLPCTRQPWLATVERRISPTAAIATMARPMRLPGVRILAVLSRCRVARARGRRGVTIFCWQYTLLAGGGLGLRGANYGLGSQRIRAPTWSNPARR